MSRNYYETDADRIVDALSDISEELVNLRNTIAELLTNKCACGCADAEATR